MGIYIKGMEMPTTGLYFVSVDNTGGRDKTVVTIERMLGNRDVRQIVGSFELVPVPPRGRCIDVSDAVSALLSDNDYVAALTVSNCPTIIPAEEGE